MHLPARLNGRGQCCGRKPLIYKHPPHKFCARCDRAFTMEGEQIENLAYVQQGEYFARRRSQRSPGTHLITGEYSMKRQPGPSIPVKR